MIYTFQFIYVNIQTYTNVLSFFLFYLCFIIILPLLLMLRATCTGYGLFQLSESNLPSYSTTSICFYTGNMLYKILTILCRLYYNRMWNWKTWFLILFRGVCCPRRSLCHCAFTVAIIYCRYLLICTFLYDVVVLEWMIHNVPDKVHTQRQNVRCHQVCSQSKDWKPIFFFNKSNKT
jgi:hypothetical protein